MKPRRSICSQCLVIFSLLAVSVRVHARLHLPENLRSNYFRPAGEEDTESETQREWGLVFLASCMFIGMLGVFVILKYHLHYLPESVMMLGLGVLCGLVVKYVDAIHDVIQFDPEFFFMLALPPVIFEAGFNLPPDCFFYNFFSVLTFAVVGTIISAVLTTLSLFYGGQLFGYDLPLFDCKLFGAITSATDPVATLSIFSALDVDRTLYILVFGESILNDAVGVVLFRTVLSGKTLSVAALEFLYINVGSVCVGLASAFSFALITKYIALHDYPQLMLVSTLLFAYTPFLMAEALGMSGLICIFFCGIAMSNYARYNMQEQTVVVLNGTLRLLAFITENGVFLFIGWIAANFTWVFDYRIVFTAIATSLVARALNVYPLANLLNVGRERPIRYQDQLVMWFSGLRGGVAFGLALSIPKDNPYRGVIASTCLSLVLFTITVFGCGTLPLLKALEPPPPPPPPVLAVPVAPVRRAPSASLSMSSPSSRANRRKSVDYAEDTLIVDEVPKFQDDLSTFVGAPGGDDHMAVFSSWFDSVDSFLKRHLCRELGNTYLNIGTQSQPSYGTNGL